MLRHMRMRCEIVLRSYCTQCSCLGTKPSRSTRERYNQYVWDYPTYDPQSPNSIRRLQQYLQSGQSTLPTTCTRYLSSKRGRPINMVNIMLNHFRGITSAQSFYGFLILKFAFRFFHVLKLFSLANVFRR